MDLKQALSEEEKDTLLNQLKSRFETHIARHESVEWTDVQNKLNDDQLCVLYNMDITGGEPDVVLLGENLVFSDFSKESPKGRRSICYDRAALEARKKHKPANSAVDLAREIGVELLTESEYRELQSIEPFDLKTSSWVLTTDDVRSLGGALFCDRRYDTVFLYHNGADSYYGARGFRGRLEI